MFLCFFFFYSVKCSKSGGKVKYGSMWGGNFGELIVRVKGGNGHPLIWGGSRPYVWKYPATMSSLLRCLVGGVCLSKKLICRLARLLIVAK